MSSRRSLGLGLLMGALAAVLLLAASLSSLKLQPGGPFPGSADSERAIQPSPNPPAAETWGVPVLQGLLAVAIVVVTALLVTRILRLANLRAILGVVLPLGLLLVLVSLLSRLPVGGAVTSFPDGAALTPPPRPGFHVAPIGQPPDSLPLVVAIVLALGLSILALNYAVAQFARKPAQNPLREEAERAITDLREGRAVGGVVIRCYRDMCRALQEARGIERDRALTVMEFEAVLLGKGFPAAPVHQLTQLFEKARYGSRPMSDADRLAALDSLGKIVRFVGNASGDV